MATCRELIDRLNAKLTGDPSLASDYEAVYKFVLEGEGGGTWLIDLANGASVKEEDGNADCTISLAADDFVGLVEGSANGQQLFFQGKLRIEGDMGLAMKLQTLAELAK